MNSIITWKRGEEDLVENIKYSPFSSKCMKRVLREREVEAKGGLEGKVLGINKDFS